MKYVSTRGGSTASAEEVVLSGWAGDGGLFLPQSIPSAVDVFGDDWLRRRPALAYRGIVAMLLKAFLDFDCPFQGLVQSHVLLQCSLCTGVRTSRSTLTTYVYVLDEGDYIRLVILTLVEIVDNAFGGGKFDYCDGGEPLALVKVGDDFHLLEMFHGSTWAFKDYSLAVLAELSQFLLKKHGRKQTQLVGQSLGLFLPFSREFLLTTPFSS